MLRYNNLGTEVTGANANSGGTLYRNQSRSLLGMFNSSLRPPVYLQDGRLMVVNRSHGMALLTLPTQRTGAMAGNGQ